MSAAPLYGGECHYWRHEAQQWPQVLADLREAGFTVVSSCVPWSVHERHKGAYDFSDNRDLASFVSLARAEGLEVHLRLGPAVGAELNGFGIPERVLARKQCQAVSGRGTPLWLPWPAKMFPAPSFASTAFREEVAAWFSALGEHLSAAEAQVSVDCDRKAMGRIGAFDGDYHPDAIEWWLDFSDKRPAPRSYEEGDMQRVLAWVRFSEIYEEQSEEWLREAAQEAGMRTAESTPTQLTIGGAPWFPVVTDAEQKNSVLLSLASGTQEFNLFMATERERWSGEALSSDWLAPLLAALHEAAFHTLHRKAPITIVASRAEKRAAIASCALEGATSTVTELIGLGPSGHAELALDSAARLYPRWLSAVKEALDLVEVPYRLLGENDLHQIDGTTKAVIVPTLRRVDGGVWSALHALDITGMRVVLGPEIPVEDELGGSLGDDAAKPAGAGLLAAESLNDIEGLAADLLELAGELCDLWIAPQSPNVTCTPFYDDSGEAQLLFVRNRSAAQAAAEANVPLGCVLRDALSRESSAESEGIAKVTLAADEIRLFRVGREESQ
ncbi:MAG: hypothetical protein GY811_30315 [Myxococcales bacterium]|nr:hypothetical protein [Myxococcales bacterium]